LEEDSNIRAEQFDPNGVGYEDNLFGLPFEPEQANLVVIPVPWEVTASYGSGSAQAPEAILKASTQVDLFQPDIPTAWNNGLAMLPIDQSWMKIGNELRQKAVTIIHQLESDRNISEKDLKTINQESNKLNNWVYGQSKYWLQKGKTPLVLGGDHSSPLGLIRALTEAYQEISLLQIDAHADLRPAYQGFTFSHASIMHNALKFPQIKRLVQVGIRDLCEQENETIANSSNRILAFLDQDMKERMFRGVAWAQICDDIVASLGDLIYISFDIDGLHPSLCPNTGTPVPGGLSYDQATYLVKVIVKSGKKIIGFDLCEVAPEKESQWDANVGARVLYRLANLTAVSQGYLLLI